MDQPLNSCHREGCPGHRPGYCTAHRTRDGKPCGSHPIAGAQVCGAHGGRAPRVRAAARRRVETARARHAADTLGLAVDIAPADALLEEVQRTAGAVRWLEVRVREIDPALLADKQAAWHPLLGIYQDERAHLVKVCTATIAAGVAERHVQLAERVGGLMADVLDAVLDDLDLTAEQQAVAATSVPDRLRLIAGGA